MDLKTLEFIADNFSFEKLIKGIIRTKIPNNKYAILRHDDIEYDDTTDFFKFILSPEIKIQTPIINDSEGEYVCNNCGEDIFDKHLYNGYCGNLCKECFKGMRDAVVVKKENITLIYTDENSCLPPIHIMRNEKIKHINITIISTNSLNKIIKTSKTTSREIMCYYCHRTISKRTIKNFNSSELYFKRKTITKLNHYSEKDGKKSITICEKCLKFREYASFMTNYNFVCINEIFIINYLLPELKQIIANHMLRIAAY